MNTTEATLRPAHHKLSAVLRYHFPDYRKNQIELLVLMVVALAQAQTVRHSKLAERFPGTAKHESVIRRIERFFEAFPLEQADLAPLVVACLPKGPQTLILDRTLWMLGSQEVNVLVLGVQYGLTTVPLLWEFLPHNGSSSQTDRIELLEDLLSLLPAQQVGWVLGDREFIGQQWFGFLLNKGLGLCIRIRDNTQTDLGSVESCFDQLVEGTEVSLYGTRLKVIGVLSEANQRVVVASNHSLDQILPLYKTRFRIECMFRFLKSKGFRLQETHMSLHDRLDRLVCLLVIVFVWAVLIGSQQKIRLNKYGRYVRAVFTQGLSLLTRAFYQPHAVLDALLAILDRAINPHQPKTVGY